MVERHISMRGETVDFNRLRLNNAKKPALGNANMNAKGDFIDSNGAIIKTQEQVEAEWATRIAEQQQTPHGVNLKDQAAVSAAAGTVVTPPGLEPKVVDPDDAGFDPQTAVVPKPRRKIVESD